jgi:hypothetical protein
MPYLLFLEIFFCIAKVVDLGERFYENMGFLGKKIKLSNTDDNKFVDCAVAANYHQAKI